MAHTQKLKDNKPNFKDDFLSTVKKWNEVLLLGVAIVVWNYSDDFLRWLDPTSATFDAGVLQKFIYAFVGTCIAHFVAWIMFKFTFPQHHKYVYEIMFQDFITNGSAEINLKAKKGDMQSIKYLTELRWKRINISLGLFSLYLFTFLAILATL